MSLVARLGDSWGLWTSLDRHVMRCSAIMFGHGDDAHLYPAECGTWNIKELKNR